MFPEQLQPRAAIAEVYRMKLRAPVMEKPDPAVFHRLYGKKQPKVTFYASDFIDYALMIFLNALVIIVSYGLNSAMSILGLALCAFALVTFIIRHGIEFAPPVILRKPQEMIYMLVYKLQNVRPIYVIAVSLIGLENWLIGVTPALPHHVTFMHKVALYLFYIHFIFITGFRTVSMIDHLRKKELVRSVLMETPWRRVIRDKTNIVLEIVHAWSTGVLTHIVSIAPWYLIITFSKFSVVFLPVVCFIDIIIQLKWYQVFNAWFYRDHWLGHNSEFEFLYLHGTHHDAIPCGMIALSENGFLEGFTRFTIGAPVIFYNPIVSFVAYTFDIKTDIELHQYIPGIFPQMSKRQIEGLQHSTHHYGPLEPYSLGSKELEEPGHGVSRNKWIFPDELRNAIKLDEELTGFEWNNPTYRRTLSLWDKYQGVNRCH
jgi:hypothetical protein